MVYNKRKKNSRQRGGWTHGWGSKKKHRGAGHRGGRGAAGSGKKGDAKKPRYWKEKYFGKTGFTSLKKLKSKDKPISLSMVSQSLDKWVAEGLAVKDNDSLKIDLAGMGYTKLLGTGSVKARLSVNVPQASVRAREKIEAAKGTVNVQS
jgi:large subunit ribosomal protein L15